MTGTRSAEGVITRSGAALHRHLSASRGCGRTSCIGFQASCQEEGHPKPGNPAFPKERKWDYRVSRARAMAGPRDRLASRLPKDQLCFFANPANPKPRNQEIPVSRKRWHSVIGRLRQAPQDLRSVSGDIPSLLKHELAFGKSGKPEIPKSGKTRFLDDGTWPIRRLGGQAGARTGEVGCALTQ